MAILYKSDLLLNVHYMPDPVSSLSTLAPLPPQFLKHESADFNQTFSLTWHFGVG